MRSRRHRGDQTPADRIAALAESAGAPVEEVLREVADFRLALETDMIIAAAAVDADELGLAADVVDGDRAGLAAFHERMLARLVDVARDDTVAPVRALPQRGRRTPVRLLAAAAGLVALIGGGAVVSTRTPTVDEPSTEQVALALADDQLSTLTGEIVRDASTAEISTAASELHETLESLIAEHAEGDPAVAEMIALLINEEQRLLDSETTPATQSVLRDVARLVRRLKRVAPPRVVATLLPVAPESAEASSKPSPKPSAKPSPKPSASPSPTPSRTASGSPKPSPSGSSSGGDSGGSSAQPLPTAGP